MAQKIEAVVHLAEPVNREDLFRSLLTEHDEQAIAAFLRDKRTEIEDYRRSLEPAISESLEGIFSSLETSEQKAESIWQLFQEHPQNTEFQTTHLRLLKTKFLSLEDQSAERQTLLGFGRRLGDTQFTPQRRLDLLQPILDFDLNVFPEDSNNPYAKLMLRMVSEVDKSGLEEKCCTLAMLSPVQSDSRIGEYLNLRPKVKAKLGEYLLKIGGFLLRETPSLSRLTEGDLRIYTAATASAGYRYGDERGSSFDPQILANNKLHELKIQAEQAGKAGYLPYLDLWRQAIAHASPITHETIVNLLTARIKPQSEFFQRFFPPFLDDLLNKAINDAIAGDTNAKALLVGLLEITQVVESESVLLPFVNEMAKSGSFSPAKIVFCVKNFFEKMGVIFDEASDTAEEVCRVFTGQDLLLEVDPEQGVNILYPDGSKKSVGRIIDENEVGTTVQDSVKEDERDALRLSFLQINELLQQYGFDEKSEDEVLDEIGNKWAEIYGPRAHRTKTLNPRRSVLRLFPVRPGQASLQIEFTYNCSQKSNRIALSDLQGALILSGDLKLPFVLAHDGILMDNGGDFFQSLAEDNLGTFLRLNSVIISRAVNALIEPTRVLTQRADTIAWRLNEAEVVPDWERRVSERLRAQMPERILQMEGIQIHQDQGMLSIKHGSAADYEERRLTLHEIAEILDSGMVSMISEERPFTPQDTIELRREIRRGSKIIPVVGGEEVRIGSIRWLGYRRDGSPMLPTWAAIENVRENFPHHRLRIRRVYIKDPDTGSIQEFILYSTFQSPVRR